MLALEGIRVLDLSRLLPGPSGTMLLADLGADVIKVEEPEDRAGVGRDILTPAGLSPEEEERYAAYNSLARNKRSIAINLKHEEGRAVLYRLVRTADAFIEGYRPGVAKRLGIDYDALSRLNPGLVYCSISGYGQDGPYRDLPGHDPNYQAIAGTLSVGHDKEGNPVWTDVPVIDYGTGLFVVIGILAGLEARRKTGRGQYVDVAMLDVAAHFDTNYLSRYLLDGKFPKRPRPQMTVLKTKDGKYIVLQPTEKHFWENLCRAIGRPDLYPVRRASWEERGRAYAEVAEIFRTRTRDEWFELLRHVDTCVAPLLETNEAPDDPQMQHRKLVQELKHPRLGKVRQAGFPLKLSDTPATFRSFAPRLGEHTEAVLRELGYAQEEVRGLEAKGAVKAAPPLK